MATNQQQNESHLNSMDNRNVTRSFRDSNYHYSAERDHHGAGCSIYNSSQNRDSSNRDMNLKSDKRVGDSSNSYACDPQVLMICAGSVNFSLKNMVGTKRGSLSSRRRSSLDDSLPINGTGTEAATNQIEVPPGKQNLAKVHTSSNENMTNG